MDLVRPCLDHLFRWLRFRWLNWNSLKGDQGKAAPNPIVYQTSLIRWLKIRNPPITSALKFSFFSLAHNRFSVKVEKENFFCKFFPRFALHWTMHTLQSVLLAFKMRKRKCKKYFVFCISFYEIVYLRPEHLKTYHK